MLFHTNPDPLNMKILLITTLVALSTADVSHLQNGHPGYHYDNPAPHNHPSSSYGAPQASVLGPSQSQVKTIEQYNQEFFGNVNGGSQLTLPGAQGPALEFKSGQPLSSSSGFQQLSSQSFGTVGPVPSVNLVQLNTQPANSFDFVNKYSQPSVSSIGLLPVNSVQVASDASLNLDSGLQNRFSTGVHTSQIYDGKTSGGSINDAFGVSENSGANYIATQFGSNANSVAVGSHAATEQDLKPQISKHLYFYAAPEDDEEVAQAKINIPQEPPKKTYKIIFIKAPTYRSQGAITLPAPPQNEEKTLVYVLVKKPEDFSQVHYQRSQPVKPSKPEVFFIKYKTQKEAEAAVAELQRKHAGGEINAVSGFSGVSNVAALSAASATSGGSTANRIAEISQDVSGANEVNQVPIQLTAGQNIVSSAPSSVNFAGSEGSFDFNGQSNVGELSTTAPASFNSIDQTSFESSTPSSASINVNFGASDSVDSTGTLPEISVGDQESVQGFDQGGQAPSHDSASHENGHVESSVSSDASLSGFQGDNGQEAESGIEERFGGQTQTQGSGYQFQRQYIPPKN